MFSIDMLLNYLVPFVLTYSTPALIASGGASKMNFEPLQLNQIMAFVIHTLIVNPLKHRQFYFFKMIDRLSV